MNTVLAMVFATLASQITFRTTGNVARRRDQQPPYGSHGGIVFFDAVFMDGRDNGQAMTRFWDAGETSNFIPRDPLENAPNRFDCG
jgi:hypothetical protein